MVIAEIIGPLLKTGGSTGLAGYMDTTKWGEGLPDA